MELFACSYLYDATMRSESARSKRPGRYTTGSSRFKHGELAMPTVASVNRDPQGLSESKHASSRCNQTASKLTSQRLLPRR